MDPHILSGCDIMRAFLALQLLRLISAGVVLVCVCFLDFTRNRCPHVFTEGLVIFEGFAASLTGIATVTTVVMAVYVLSGILLGNKGVLTITYGYFTREVVLKPG